MPSLTDRDIAEDAGIASGEAARRLAQEGANEVPERRTPSWVAFATYFWSPSACLLEVVAVLFGALQRMNELWLTLGLLLANAVIGSAFSQRASHADTSRRARVRVGSYVRRDGNWSLVPAATLVRGDLVRVRAGDIVPADVRLVTGLVILDTRTNTGSSLAVERWVKDVIHAGSLVRRGESMGVVVATGTRTRYGRAVELVSQAAPTLRIQHAASRASHQMLAAGCVTAVVGVGLASLDAAPLDDACALALLLLVSAAPATLSIAIAATMSSSAARLAERGALVTRVNVLEDAARLDMLCMDAFASLDARERARELDGMGVSIKLLTAAALPVAEGAAAALGVGPIVPVSDFRRNQRLIHDHAGLADALPDDELNAVRRLQEAEHVVGVTGEGVDDYRTLRQADVGIATRESVDVAKAAAGVLLTGEEGLGAIIDLVRASRDAHHKVLTWVVDWLSRCVLIAGFLAATLTFTDRLVMSPTGLLLLLLLTDLVRPALATDRVPTDPRPETNDDRARLVVAIALGAAQVVEALGALAIGATVFDLAESSEVLATFSFELLLFFSIFSFLSIREGRAFWRSAPSLTLGLGLGAVAVAGLSLGMFGGLDVQPLSVAQLAFIVGAALVSCLGINDVLKTSLLVTAAPVRVTTEQAIAG